MITIDFPFFASMHERLRQPFNAADYNLEQLNILYNSQNMLRNREFCSEEFADGANEYFANHKSELTKVVALNKSSGAPLPAIIAKIIAEYSSLENAIAYINTLNTETYEEGVVYVSIKTSEYSSFAMPAERFTAKVTEAFEKASGTMASLTEDLQNYYETWLSDKTGYEAGEMIRMIDFLSEIINSANSIEKLLISFGQTETAERLGEEIGNRLWLDNKDSMEKAKSLARGEYQEFFAKMIEYKGFDGLRLLLQVTGSDAQMNAFFNTGGKDLSIDTSEKADALYNELSALVLIVNYDIIDLNHLKDKLDIESFKKLAEFYQMPQNIIEKLLTEELQDIKSEDNISDIFSEKTFQLSIPYTKTNGQQGIKNYTVELLPKSDPTALFVGKMTNCCQFYTGDSSDQAVMPVYKDPNAGLIVVKEKGKVKGASFVWLTQDNGLVLDSFEHLPEAQKAFLPFIAALSNKVAEHGHKLYLGSGGKTPKLKYAHNVKVETQERAEPLSAEFKPYRDSRNVYLIEPNTEYTIDDNKEGNALTAIIESLSVEQKEEIEDAYKKFDSYHLTEIADACKINNLDFVETLKIMTPHTNDCSRILSSVFLTKLLTSSPEVLKYALANIQYTDLPKLSEIWIGNKEEIENLASNLKTLTAEQTEKVISNQFLKNLLIRNPEVLKYALENIKDEYLPKLSDITICNKKEIENLASNLTKLNSEQIDMAISDNSITESYESIKDRFGIIDEVTNTIDGSEYKDIGGVIVTDPNAAQEWAESKIVGEDVYSADQL
jgi:hypothetical protein